MPIARRIRTGKHLEVSMVHNGKNPQARIKLADCKPSKERFLCEVTPVLVGTPPGKPKGHT